MQSKRLAVVREIHRVATQILAKIGPEYSADYLKAKKLNDKAKKLIDALLRLYKQYRNSQGYKKTPMIDFQPKATSLGTELIHTLREILDTLQPILMGSSEEWVKRPAQRIEEALRGLHKSLNPWNVWTLERYLEGLPDVSSDLVNLMATAEHYARKSLRPNEVSDINSLITKDLISLAKAVAKKVDNDPSALVTVALEVLSDVNHHTLRRKLSALEHYTTQRHLTDTAIDFGFVGKISHTIGFDTDLAAALGHLLIKASKVPEMTSALQILDSSVGAP